MTMTRRRMRMRMRTMMIRMKLECPGVSIPTKNDDVGMIRRLPELRLLTQDVDDSVGVLVNRTSPWF